MDQKRCFGWLGTVLVVLGLLLVVTGGVTQAQDGEASDYTPVVLWYQADSAGAQFRIYNDAAVTAQVRLELWPISQRPFRHPQRPSFFYLAEFVVEPHQTVLAVRDGWPRLSPGEYWVPARFWVTPGPSGIAGADPFALAGLVSGDPALRLLTLTPCSGLGLESPKSGCFGFWPQPLTH